VKLATYVVGQGDTVEILAQKLLGDVIQESTLITLNQLRYPFISDNPIDQYARPKGNVFLIGSVTNPTSVTISNPNSVLVNPNDTVFLLEGSANGAGVVKSISGNTITFNAVVNGAFDQAAIVTVFANQQNVTTQVLKTGDTLLYPHNPTIAAAQPSSYSLLLGTDLQLDDDGFLLKSNGDIATVSALANLVQAVQMRLQTPLGALMLHPQYGNELFDVMGEAGNSYFKGLAKHYIEECVLQDTRITSVVASNLAFSKDAMTVDLAIVPIGAQDPITQSVSIPITGAV